jgi:hypothetical protein
MQKEEEHGKRKTEIVQHTTPGAHLSDRFYCHFDHNSIDDGFVFGCQVILE